MNYIEIFGVKINNITFDEAIDQIKRFLNSDKLNVIYTPNPEIVMGAKENINLRNLLNRGDLVTADGIGLIYASKLKKKPLKERVTGYYMSMKMLEIANENKYGLYILGGKEGVSKSAVENIKKQFPNIRIAGDHHGYFKGAHVGLANTAEELKIIEDINKSNADIIFVGLGFPKQEIWIDTHRDKLNAKIIIGNGGVIDILSGDKEPAPKIFEKLGLEWFYRLVKEPSRIKRQLVIPKFMLTVLFSKDVVK